MPRDNLVYLSHILEHSEKILKFIGSMSEDDFMNDEKTQSAVIREFEVMGEASKRITEDFKNLHPAIPWKILVAMRNLLIHDYEGVNPLRVWDTAVKDIPPLVDQLKTILKK